MPKYLGFHSLDSIICPKDQLVLYVRINTITSTVKKPRACRQLHCGSNIPCPILILKKVQYIGHNTMPIQQKPRNKDKNTNMLLTWTWESSIMENLQCTTRLTLRRFGHVDVIRSMSSLICRLNKLNWNQIQILAGGFFLYNASPFVHGKDGIFFYPLAL